jgi:hypothetical protein
MEINESYNVDNSRLQSVVVKGNEEIPAIKVVLEFLMSESEAHFILSAFQAQKLTNTGLTVDNILSRRIFSWREIFAQNPAFMYACALHERGIILKVLIM